MALHEGWRERVRPLLQLNDRLRELTALESDINVTSIVAVGDQSHGKTSVIEALSGIDLPRGEGIQTRVPLVLKLRDAGDGAERAQIKADGHDVEKLASLSDTAEAVRRWTDRLAGTSKDVKDLPVELTVFRKDQDDLTLIDLPGMTRVAIDGQSEDIETTITAMYERYMKPQESILLNVVNAMVDFTTSKSLQMAQRLDPKRCRTLLCITKLDQHREPGLYQKVTEAESKFGCPVFCVRNRSQEENNKAIPLDEMRRRELAFFHDHAELCSLDKESTGIVALSSKLVAWQAERLQQTLPTKRTQIRQRIEQLEAEQRDFEQIGDSVGEMRRFLRERLSNSAAALKNSALGRSTNTKFITPEKSNFTFPLKFIQEGFNDAEIEFVLEGTPLSICCKPELIVQKATYQTPEYHNVSLQIRAKSPATIDFSLDVTLLSPEKTVTQCTLTNGRFHSHDIDFGVDFTIAVKVFKIQSSEQSALLCARIKQLSDAMEQTVHAQLHPNDMLSKSVQEIIQSEAKSRHGAFGMPDTIPPEVGPAIIGHFLKRIEDPVRQSLRNMHRAVLAACQSEFESWAHHFPALSELVATTIEHHLQEKLKSGLSAIKTLFTYEQTIDTLNHYFMANVQAVRSALLATEEKLEHLEPAVQAFVKRHRPIQTKSNLEQREIDLQMDIFAYWKVLDKRLLDTIMLASRCHLVSEPLLRDELLDALFAEAFGVPDLKSLLQLDDSRQRKLEYIAQRLKALTQAEQELERVLASGACRGIF